MSSQNEKPIVFNSEMVRAILDGRKTQTRRIIDFKKIYKQSGCSKGKLFYSKTFNSWAVDGNNGVNINLVKCPYGKVGDKLWVRERHYVYTGCLPNPEPPIRYYADNPAPSKDENPQEYSRWLPKPSRFLPRRHARIFLEITGIRVERVKGMSFEDVYAEGIKKTDVCECCTGISNDQLARNHFADLWDSINKKRGYGWDANPWCWCVSFKRVEK